MNFVGSVGMEVMANSGVEELLQKRFAGVQKLLVSKNYPSNVCALRFLVEGILKPYISRYKIYEELMTALETKVT